MCKTGSICLKEHVYGVSISLDNFREMFGSSWDSLAQHFLQFDFYTISQFFFTHSLKFYSGGAVDLWSSFPKKYRSVDWLQPILIFSPFPATPTPTPEKRAFKSSGISLIGSLNITKPKLKPKLILIPIPIYSLSFDCYDFTSRLDRALKFLGFVKNDQSKIFMEYHIQDHIRAMFGPCCNLFWPSSSVRLGRALPFQGHVRFTLIGLASIGSKGVSYFGTMS